MSNYPSDGFMEFFEATKRPGPCFKCGKIEDHKDTKPMHMVGMMVFVCHDCYNPIEEAENIKLERELDKNAPYESPWDV